MTQIQLQESANIAAHGEELAVRDWREYFSFIGWGFRPQPIVDTMQIVGFKTQLL